MAGFDFDIGVIGGGAAGLTVASGAARLGARTLLLEKESALGGDCLHYGCVPSKTLIRIAQVYHQMKRAAFFGLPQVEALPVDFKAVVAHIREVIAEIQRYDSEERFCSLGVKVVFGEPSFRDEHAIFLNGRTYSARNWVVATGSSPSVPPIEGLRDTPFLTNRDIFSLDRLPGSMMVLGGGPIAVEMAQAFARLGTRVSVVQRSSQILSREDKDMADGVMAALEAQGVSFHLGTSIARTADLGTRREVVLRGAEGRESSLEAEVLLVAMGRRPNLEGLGLEGIGVELEKGGVKVDSRMRTSQKRVFAAGDVTGSFQFTHAAGYEAAIVVSNAVFHLPRKADYTFLPWCTYTDPELASIGKNEKAAQDAGIRYAVWTEDFRTNDRSLAAGERIGRIKMILDDQEKPIGVQILGPQAGELLAEWVAVLNGKVRLSTLASAVHPYPTLAEINKKVAGSYFSSKIFSEKVRKGLKFFFHLKGRACGMGPD